MKPRCLDKTRLNRIYDVHAVIMLLDCSGSGGFRNSIEAGLARPRSEANLPGFLFAFSKLIGLRAKGTQVKNAALDPNPRDQRASRDCTKNFGFHMMLGRPCHASALRHSELDCSSQVQADTGQLSPPTNTKTLPNGTPKMSDQRRKVWTI